MTVETIQMLCDGDFAACSEAGREARRLLTIQDCEDIFSKAGGTGNDDDDK